MRVVYDANVVAGGVCWRGEAYLCLVQFARREVQAWATDYTLAETREAAARLMQKYNPPPNAANILQWYLRSVDITEPVPLGKQRSRDAKDDPYLAAAVAARAAIIVSYDKDLLDLGKPFGVEIVRPSQFLRMIKG